MNEDREMNHPPAPRILDGGFSGLHLIGAAFIAIGVMFGCAALTSLLVRAAFGGDERREAPATTTQDPGVLLANPIAMPEQWEVDCSATTATNLLVDTGGVTHATSTLAIVNGSSTCIQVGGPTVTSTTGVPVGTGATCYGGAVFSMDARNGYCLSVSGTVTVDVLGGRQ